MAQRLRGRYGYPEDNPFTPTMHPDRLEEPLQWRKPATVFVVSMGDLFHHDIPRPFIFKVLAIVDACQAKAAVTGHCNHRWMFLTKRVSRMLDIMSEWFALRVDAGLEAYGKGIWLGVSASDQATYDLRVEQLVRSTLQVIKFVSLEPLIAPVDIEGYAFKLSEFPRGQWPRLIITGGESGQGKNIRPVHPGWVRWIRDRCGARLIDFCFKQWGEWGAVSSIGDDPDWHRRSAFAYPDGSVRIDWNPGKHNQGAIPLARIGKKKAGRLLDGRLHDMPPMNGGRDDN
jgi:protein gp37